MLKRLEKLKSQGIKVVGYTESSISMAGIGVAWLAPKLGLKAVIYDPQYTNSKANHLEVLEKHRLQWKQFNAEIIPIKAGMIKINYNICKKHLKENYPDSIMLPLGLPFQETIDETAKIASEYNNKFYTVVVCVGSGTICAGILKGMPNAVVIGVMSRSGNKRNKRNQILSKARLIDGGLMGCQIFFEIIDDGWDYTDECDIEIPFPCHPYYDAKAWNWLVNNINKLDSPILFWNIGS